MSALVDHVEGGLVAGRQQHAERVDLAQHLAQQRRRVGPVERHDGQVEPGRREQRHHVFHRRLEEQGDAMPVVGGDRMVPQQFGGERRGVRVEVGVAEATVAGHQRGCGRLRPHPPGEGLGHGGEGRRGTRTPAGLGQAAAVGAHQLGQRARVGAGQRVQAAPEQLGRRGHVGGVEVLVGVLPEAVEAGLVRDDREGERALGLGRGQPDRPGRAAGQRQRGEVRVVEDEEEVEQRRVGAEVVVGDGVRERHVLRVEHRAYGVGLSAQLRPQFLGGCQRQGQQHRVGEHADTRLEVAYGPVRHRAGDARMGAAGHPVHGPAEERQQQREAGQSQLGAEPVEGGTAFRADRGVEQVVPGAAVLPDRPQRRGDLRHVGVVAAQGVALCPVGRPGEPLGLPPGVVQRRRGGLVLVLGRAGQRRRVRGRQPAEQDVERPAVDRDVVQVQQEHPAAVAGQPVRPQHARLPEVEGGGEEGAGALAPPGPVAVANPAASPVTGPSPVAVAGPVAGPSPVVSPGPGPGSVSVGSGRGSGSWLAPRVVGVADLLAQPLRRGPEGGP